MGGAISILQAANRPDSVSELVLIAPALPIAIGALPDPLVTATFAGYALPMIGEWFLATSGWCAGGGGHRVLSVRSVERKEDGYSATS